MRKRVLKKSLFLMLCLFCSFGVSVTSAKQINQEDQIVGIIKIDLGDVERRAVNLEANYDYDFNDLVSQFKSSHEKY